MGSTEQLLWYYQYPISYKYRPFAIYIYKPNKGKVCLAN